VATSGEDPVESSGGANLRFDRGAAAADDIQRVAEEVVAELSDAGSEASEAARAAGLDPAALAGAEVSVKEEDQDVDPGTAILVGIAIKAGSHVAIRFWDEVIWRRVQRRLGDDALGDRKE
jgi:hypothetical protein